MLAQPASISFESLRNHLDLKQVVFGESACSALPGILRQLAARRVLLVRDPAATDASGISTSLRDCLSKGHEYGEIDVATTLAPKEVDHFGAACARRRYDCIVAVGGGATIDAAKLIALRASNSRPIDQLIKDGFSPNEIPLVAVPTTAGSGSEATHFAVLFVDQKKYSLAHSSLRPRWAVVDPSLTHSVPQRVAAAAGLDALCQSIESLWSRNADSESVAFAGEALRLVADNLYAAVKNRDPGSQARLSLGSHLAGQAINRSFTTVCHALSYALTSKYGITHGLAAAATMPAAVLFHGAGLPSGRVEARSSRLHHAAVSVNKSNFEKSSDPGASDDGDHCIARCLQSLRRVFECNDLGSVAARLVQLIRSIGGAASISELQLPDDYQAPAHAESVDYHRLQNNPRTLSQEEIVRLLLTKFDDRGRPIT
jgi:alcohol dehydrogenase class IV